MPARYEISTSVKGAFAEVKARVVDALKAQGFGVLTEIDVQKTLKEKLGVEMEPYIILGACNPPLAHRAFGADLDVGLLLPCNVVVYETGSGESVVGLLNPMVMATLFADPTFAVVASEAQQRFERVAAALKG